MKKTVFGLLSVVVFLAFACSAMAYSIRDDATGGDCAQIGIWDQTSRTCTLSTDPPMLSAVQISIDADGITLDGNGHSLTGYNWYDKGIAVYYRTGITLRNLILNNHHWGIYLWESSNINVQNNAFNGSFVGISSYKSSPIYTNNTFSNDYIALSPGENDIAYNNNFINTRVLYYGSTTLTFSQPAPAGGNYWSNYDSPEEGCSDLNVDGFCDAPYSYNTYLAPFIDYLPWTVKDGWLPPAELIESTANTIQEMINSGEITSESTATSLTSVLDSAITAEQNGNEMASDKILEGFIRQVEGQAMAGRISEDAAAKLIESARMVINK